jgi:hypothetical protein
MCVESNGVCVALNNNTVTWHRAAPMCSHNTTANTISGGHIHVCASPHCPRSTHDPVFLAIHSSRSSHCRVTDTHSHQPQLSRISFAVLVPTPFAHAPLYIVPTHCSTAIEQSPWSIKHALSTPSDRSYTRPSCNRQTTFSSNTTSQNVVTGGPGKGGDATVDSPPHHAVHGAVDKRVRRSGMRQR